MITKENFFTNTICQFTLIASDAHDEYKCARKWNELFDIHGLHFKSKTSMYIYTDEGVYRLSDHWGKVASCTWDFEDELYTHCLVSCEEDEFTLGYAKWTDFKIKEINNA